MKHAAFPSMTFTALASRADEVRNMDCVADYLGNDDLREVTAFLAHDGSLRCGNLDYDDSFTLESKEIIGVALCDLDDPQAEIEIMDRDTAYATFGRQWVEDLEVVG